MPKVSIIVPVYNTGLYLNKCLNSLVNQTLEDIEIIVVNDGSTDNSQKIIDEFTNKYPSKIISLKKENGGLSDARNFGIKHASGEYIGFVDSDDYIDIKMYEIMYNKIVEDNSDLVECNFIWEYPNKNKFDNGMPYESKNSLFLYGRVMACNKLIKASIIKNNNIVFPLGLFYEDVEFFYKLVPYFEKCSFINNYFYHYTQRRTSIINLSNNKTADIFTILDNILSYFKRSNLYDEYQKQLEYLYIRLLLGSSFLRIIKIKDKKVRNELLNRTMDELYNIFPKWKKNHLLNKYKNKKNIFYKTINKVTFKIYSFIFCIIY